MHVVDVLRIFCCGSVMLMTVSGIAAPSREELDRSLREAVTGAAGALNQNPRIAYQRLGEDGWPVYYEVHSLPLARILRADRLWPGGSSGLDLDGSTSPPIGHWDTGRPLLSHEAIVGRVEVDEAVPVASSHATQVAGLLIASVADTSIGVSGIAPGGTILYHDWSGDLQEMLTDAHAGMQVSNHSYGSAVGWTWSGDWYWHGDPAVSQTQDARFGHYDGTSQYIDEISWFKPWYLPVQSAGNHRMDTGPQPGESHWVFLDGGWQSSMTARERDGGAYGYDCLGPRAVCRNALVVGSCNQLTSYTGPSDVDTTLFSSRGPTDDGRIKPDLVVPGVSNKTLSMASDSSYSAVGGTSTSAPAAAAGAQLLQEQAIRQSGQALLASSVKALLIQGCREAGPAPGPDYTFGWGLMDLEHSAELLLQDEAAEGLLESNLAASSSHSLSMVAAADSARVTLCWTDFPVAARPLVLNDRQPLLVHDLNIAGISSQGGTTAWCLNPESPELPAVRGINSVDNVEVLDMVLDPGTDLNLLVWRSDTHGYDQPYSLVWEGLVPQANLRARLVENQPQSGDTLRVLIELASAHRFEGLELELSWPTQALSILEVLPGELVAESGVLQEQARSAQGLSLVLASSSERTLIAHTLLVELDCLLLSDLEFTLSLEGSRLISQHPGHLLEVQQLGINLPPLPPEIEFDEDDLIGPGQIDP